MNDQLKIIIQALIDKQKTESQINAQIKQIKTEALKIGVTVDDKTISSALKEQTKLAQTALNNQKQSLEKILKLKTQIAQTDSTNKNTLNVLNQQLNAEQANYKILSQESNKYNEIISKEERRKTLTQETVALADKLRLATAGKADTSIQQQQQAVTEYNKTINDTLRSLNAMKNSVTFKNNTNNVKVQGSLSEVNSLINAYKNLQIQMGTAKSPEALEQIRLKLKSLNQEFSTVSNSAKSLEQILKTAGSATKLTNDKNILNNQITSWLKNNTKAAGDFGETLKNIQKQIKTADTQQLKNLRGQFRSIQTEASSLGKLGGTTFNKLFDNFRKFASWVGIGNIFMSGVRSIRDGINYLKELDNALTLINITMPVTSGQMQELADKSNEMAKQLGISTTQVLKAATIYANANESAESILQKSQATVMLGAVSGLDTSMTSDIIQGAINQFDLAEDSAMHVSDVFQKVSENMAVDFSKGISEISQGIAVSGSVAKDAGLSLEEYASMIGTIVEKTRISGSTVGQALRTIFTRITKASVTGESSTEDISKAETSLRAVGIEVRKDKDTFRELDEILGDLAGKWETLTDVQKSNIAYEIAGTRQTSIVKSLLSDYGRYIDILGEANNAEGTSAENQAIVVESLAGKLGTFKATVEGLWQNANLTDSMKSAVDAGTSIVSVLSQIIDKLGVIGTIIASITTFNLAKTFVAPAVLSQLSGISNILSNFKGIQNVAVGIQSFNTALASANGSIIPLASSIDSLSYSQQALLLSSQKVNANMAEQILMTNGMTKADASLMLSKYGLITTSQEVSTAQLDELLMSIALTEEKKKAILVSLGYINSTTGEVIPLKAVTAEKLTNTLVTEGLSTAEAEAIITSLGFGAAQTGSAVGVKSLTGAIWLQVKAIGAWLLTNPVGWLVLAAGAVAGAIALFDLFTVSLEEQREKTEKLKEEYDGLTQKINEINSQLETTNTRIDELNAKDNLTFVEKEELDNLKETNFQLERQNEILKDQQEIQGKKQRNSIKEEYEKDFNKNKQSASEFLLGEQATTKNEDIQNQLDKYKQLQIYLNDIRNGTLNLSYDDLFNESNKDRNSLVERATEISDYITRLKDAGATETDAFLVQLQSDFEEIDRALNPAEYKTFDFEKIVNADEFKSELDKVKNIAKDGEFSFADLTEKVPNLVAALKDSGFTATEIKEQFGALFSTISDDPLDETEAEVLTFSDTLESVSSNLDLLSTVQKELTDDQKLSIGTIQKLAEAGMNYNTVVGTNGESLRDLILNQLDAELSTKRLELAQLRLNAQTEAMQGGDWSQYSAQISQLASEISSLEATKQITIDTQYTPKDGKEEVPEQIQNFKDDEAKYQNYVNMKKMSEQEFMDWYENAYKNAYKGYENSEVTNSYK